MRQTTFTPVKENYVIPCRYMKFCLGGYHECLAQPVEQGRYCVCSYFFDIGGFSSIKELEETRNNVDKQCPKGYSFEEIETMIQPLMDRVNWNRRPSYKLNKKQRERQQRINEEIHEVYREMAK